MKKIVVSWIALISFLALSACQSPSVTKTEPIVVAPSKKQSQDSSTSNSSNPSSTSSSSTSESSSSSSSQTTTDNQVNFEEKINAFLTAFYTYTTTNDQAVQSAGYLTPELQKRLNLVTDKKSITMNSRLISADLYKREGNEYLALIRYSLNTNSVAPEVVVMKIAEDGVINSIEFPTRK